MELPRLLTEALHDPSALRMPPGLHPVAPHEILAYRELHSGLRQAWGQTLLVHTATAFVALTRASYSSPWEYLPLRPLVDTSGSPQEARLRLHKFELLLTLEDYTGYRYQVQIYDLERRGVEAFLRSLQEHLEGILVPPPPEEPPAPPPAALPRPTTLRQEMDLTLGQIEELPEDPTTLYVMEHLERLLFKANEYLQFGTENDPLERLGRTLESFFVRQGERFFSQGSGERRALKTRLEALKEAVARRTTPKRASPLLSSSQKHDRDTHIRTGDLLAQRPATQEEALLSYKKALEIDPTCPPALLGALGSCIALKDPKAARHYYEIALQHIPKGPQYDTLLSLGAGLH